MKKVLMIAYAFPPLPYAGTYRTLRFCKYLPDYGWRPVVLTIRVNQGMDKDFRLLDGIPEDVEVHRTRFIDPLRAYQRWVAQIRTVWSGKRRTNNTVSDNPYEHTGRVRNWSLARRLKDCLIEFITTPDHMVFWVPFAVIRGIRIMLKQDIDVIYTSSPPHSSQIAGLILSKLFRKPWVVDFRDPWGENVAADMIWRSRGRKWIEGVCERMVIRRADRVLAPSDTIRLSLERRFAELCRTDKFLTVLNGYDPADFSRISPSNGSVFKIAHVGSFYLFQSPEPFLGGLKQWLEQRPKEMDPVKVTFAGAKSESTDRLIKRFGLESVVDQVGLVPHAEAIQIMQRADLLILIVGFRNGAEGIPTSKLYEYLASGRPILAIAPEGEAAARIREAKAGIVVTSAEPRAIATGLQQAYRIAAGNEFHPDAGMIAKHDVWSITGQLARILNGFGSSAHSPR